MVIYTSFINLSSNPKYIFKMKKIVIFLFLAITSLFLSCKNDDDSPIVVDASLVPGEWSLSEIKSEDGKVTTTIENVPISGNYSITGKDYTAKITFTEVSDTNKSNTFVSSGGFTVIATIKIPTQSIDYEQVVPDFLGAGEWKVEDTKLFTTVAGKEKSFEIIDLTDKTMRIKTDIKETVEQEGFTFEVTGSQIFTLTKK